MDHIIWTHIPFCHLNLLMEVEDCQREKAFSPTLASFEPYIALYEKYIPEKIKVEKRLSEIKEYGKSKRVKKEMPRYPEKVVIPIK